MSVVYAVVFPPFQSIVWVSIIVFSYNYSVNAWEYGFLSYQVLMPRTIEGIRKKRKVQNQRKRIAKKMRAFCVREGSCDHQCHSPHCLEPDATESDHRWDDIISKEKKLRDAFESREERLEQEYGEYVDPQPCFPPRHEVSQIKLPSYIDVHDRIAITTKLHELESSREQAKEVACYYRDRFYEFKIKIKELESKNFNIQVECLRQNQKVRHFWRNQVLEEKTRSGRILKMALTERK